MEDPNLLTSKNRRNVVTITEVDSMYIVHDVIADVITIHEMLSVVETQNNGNTYTNIATINPVPSSMKKNHR